MLMKRFSEIDKRKVIESKKGFTLIEVIAVLLIVGVMAALGGLGMVQAVKGYLTVKQNAAITQKAQLAMSRITKEIIEMVNVPSAASSTVLPITNCSANVCEVRTVGLDSGAVKIAFGSNTLANGDTLMDNVRNFTLRYCSGSITGASACSLTSWPSGDDIHLSAVDVSLTIANPNGGNLTFLNRISPRNNGNLGGANIPPNIPSGTPATWNINNCFVATAAYGDPAHYMVQILRDFRDHYLFSLPGGQWFIKQYYEHGPAAADLIRNRPVAMWMVRCLLAPIVALIFCLLYAPMVIPFVFFAALIMTMAFFAAYRRKFAFRSSIFRSRGSILIGLIITMVVMALLAAAMVPMFSSSYMNQVHADRGRKAYYLAESGYRYAASQFLWAGTESARYDVILDLNGGTSGTTSSGKTCTLMNNTGSFTTVMYPWYSHTFSYAGGALKTNYIGTADPAIINNTSEGYIAVGSESPAFYSYNSRSVTGSTITYSGIAASSPTTTVSLSAVNAIVRPVAKATGGSFSKGGTLQLSSGFEELPLLNGNFTLISTSGGKIRTSVSGGDVFNYKSRNGDTLYNITLADANRNATWDNSEVVNVPTLTNVVLDEFIRIASTGRTPDGTTYPVTYNTSIGWIHGGSFRPVEDSIDALEKMIIQPGKNTVDSTTGRIDVKGTDDKDSLADYGFLGMILQFLLVDIPDAIYDWFWGTCDPPNPQINYVGANITQLNVNPAQSWLDAQGFLSYDIQVKVEAQDQKHFFAGPTFRSRTTTVGGRQIFATYGISFAKARRYWHSSGTRGCTACFTVDQIGAFFPGVEENPLWQWCAGLEYTGSSDVCSRGPDAPSNDYSLPAIILWKIDDNDSPSADRGRPKMLAYRVLTEADGIVSYNSTTKAWRLNPNYSTLLVRVAEGYEITFTNGSQEIKKNDVISNAAGTRRARVVMTPVLTSGSWAGGNAAGTLVVANVNNGASGATFSSGALYAGGAQAAVAAGLDTTKRNYIRAYFSHPGPADQGTPNNVETDNNRHANQIGQHNWPPDNLTDLAAGNDYFTLVQWTGTSSYTQQDMYTWTNSNGWTLGTHWCDGGWCSSWCLWAYYCNGAFCKMGCNSEYEAQSPSFAVTAGETYDVTIRYNSMVGDGLFVHFGCQREYMSLEASSIFGGTYRTSFKPTTSGNIQLILHPDSSTTVNIEYITVKRRISGAMQSTSEPLAIIRDNSLTSPSPSCMTGDSTQFTCTAADFVIGSNYGDSFGLLTIGNTATNISYDDWWIRMDEQRGTGLTPPIQQ